MRSASRCSTRCSIRAAGRIASVTPLKAFALGLNAERTLVEGRTVRIGNAAQTLHPVAGQGLNLGLRDAFELVQRAASNDRATSTRRCAALEWQRAPDRWAHDRGHRFPGPQLHLEAARRWARRAALGMAALQARRAG